MGFIMIKIWQILLCHFNKHKTPISEECMSKMSVEFAVFTYNFLGVKAMVAVVGGVIVPAGIIVAVVFTASATETACNTGFFNFPTCEGKLYDTFTNSRNTSL